MVSPLSQSKVSHMDPVCQPSLVSFVIPMDNKAVGQQVRVLRKGRGWTPQMLADFAGVGLETVKRVERGRDTRVTTLGAIAGALDVDLSTLTEAEPKQAPVVEPALQAVALIAEIRERLNRLDALVPALRPLRAKPSRSKAMGEARHEDDKSRKKRDEEPPAAEASGQ